MKIKVEQLARTLSSADELRLYWLSGDEPLLMQEAADLIRKHSRDKGFTEREVFNVDKGFDWSLFSGVTGNLSLFAEQKIIELRFNSAKLDDAAKKSLQKYLEDPNPDFLLLLSSPKLDASTLKTKWFGQIESKGVLVQIWPINRENLHDWLNQRLMREGINAEPNAIKLLADKVEGNLLAAVQEIEKLKLLANAKQGASIALDAKTVMSVVADSSRYSVYGLVDAALTGDAARSQKMLQRLRSEGVYPLVILNALSRELRSLLPMVQQKAQGQAIGSIIQANRVWFNRKNAVSSALKRLRVEQIWQLLDEARGIDQSIKGLSQADPWTGLSSLLLSLSGVTTATTAMRG